ncbi:hypothetical protein [Nocardioides sp.]|jgi:hypothetical protein|uniref:hypothetical protein n=1 Tax=Nocardioides sp. TaxID=35761 RepID=UPI002B6BEEE8|nr:hypothetical protein [Nocardioides sp.]HVX55505.1 hypothetical protein [Nocardioides sp.]
MKTIAFVTRGPAARAVAVLPGVIGVIGVIGVVEAAVAAGGEGVAPAGREAPPHAVSTAASTVDDDNKTRLRRMDRR